MRRPGHTEPLFLYDAHIQRQDLASFCLGHLCEACGLRLYILSYKGKGTAVCPTHKLRHVLIGELGEGGEEFTDRDCSPGGGLLTHLSEGEWI